jgi:hypothetical protein
MLLRFRVVTVDGVWIGKLDLLTPLVTTSNYSAIADLHTLQITSTLSLLSLISLVVSW